MKKSILTDNQEHTDIFTARTPTISVMFTAFAFIIWAGCICYGCICDKAGA